MRPVLLHLLIFATCLSLAIPAGAQFQRQFGTNLDETFNKVIKSGTNYYVLGTAEITNGQPPRATVTRLNAAGELQWTLSVNTASQWNDAVLTPNGDLLVVGRSLPDDNTSRAIMGRVTATGSFAWLRSYDQPNRDGFDRIARNPVPQTGTHPYYVLGHQLQALPAVDDVFLMNIDENGDINWKKIYLSTADDEFTNVLLAMPNGDLILAGHRGGEGLVMRADNTGALFNGATPSQPFTFIDVASAGGAGFYAVGYNFQQEKVQLISFDIDLFNQWETTLNGFTAVNNVFTAAGSIFVGGRKVREACARMSVGAGGPTLTWVKTLDNGVLTQTSSHLSFLSPAQIAYVDGRTVETGGFGQNCAFMSVSDLELNSCMTEVEDGVSLTQVSTLFNGPQLPEIEFYDEPMGADLTGGPRTWQQGNACPDPANAIIIGVKYKTCEGLPYSDQTPIAGWVIQLMNSQGAIIGEQVTGADGSYAFDGLPAGQYIVKEVAQPGWTPNVPASGQLAVTLAASEQRIVNFGNCPPPQLFCACPAGSLPANNNLAANGDFSGSNTGFSSGYTFSNSSPLQPGQYWVGSNPSQINAGFTSCGDHTTGSGNMLVVNGGASTSSTIWCQTYTVTPNSSYLFEVWVASLTSASPANLMLFVNNVSYGAGFFASGTSCNWEKYCTLWESGTNTSVTLCLVDLNTAGTGNDFALDDISFRRCISTFGHVIGRVYETCDALPYTNQPVLPGWTVQLLDDTGTVLAEQVTGANGDYAFADLPLGLYYCRVVNQPGWTPNVPPSGEYIANLDTPGETILDFGMCPACSCDSIFTYIHQEFGTSETINYYLSIFNTGTVCFPYIELVVDTGNLVSWTDLLPGWETELINPQTLRLLPPNGDIPYGAFTAITFTVSGSGVHSFITPTAVLGFACTAGPGRSFPSPPVSPGPSCCPSGSTAGPEMVFNGEFNNAVLPSSDYSPRVGSLSPGEIDIMDQTQTFASNSNWVCPGKTGVNDKFLAVDGSGVSMAAAWKQQISASQLIADRNYVFCFQTSNMVKTAKTPYADPRLFMQIVDDTNPNVVWTGGPYIIPESPKAWVPISMNWTAPANLSASYTLKIFTTPYNTDFPGNDFALDCISFRECISPCTASITTTNVDNCGHVQLNAIASGPSGYSYQWCSGESTQMLDLMLPCGEHDFCVSVTCADGSVASDAITVVVSDNIPPSINCPQDMTFTALDPNCDMPVFGIHSLGATDNCGTPTVTYAVSGATTASGSGDASGTTFSSGTSTVTYTATDLCNNTSSCSFDVTIDCDTCACLGFQNMEFYNFLSGPNLPAFCDSTTIMLPCIGSDALYWFQWGLLCSDPLCQQSYSYSIVPASGGPALISGTVPLGSPPFLNFAYNQLSGPGNYTIILTGHCGTDSCVCNINFSVPDCCDCGGFSDMTYRPTQGIMNLSFMCGDTMGVVCDQVFLPQVGGLFQCVGSSCTSSNLIQWTLTDPQGNVIQSSSAPIIASPGFNFTLDPTWFVQPGIYALTMTGMCGGQPCTPCVLYLESLGCNCHCGNFSNMYLRSANAPPGVAVNCGEAPVQVDCPSSNLSLQFTGVFECENGNVCPDSALVNWVLIRLPNDIVATGNMIASPFFGLSILPSWYAVPGTYEIQLSGTCGSDSCACSIQFTVDCPEACVCDSDDFEEDLNRGFSTTLFDNSCEACFASILMTDCDVIEWSIDGVSYGSSIGGMMFFHTFTSAGTYSVTMSVTRFNADGSVCQFGTFTQTVIVTCGSNDCGNSVFINSDFNMGAVPGGMNSGGATQGWSSISGEPIVVEGETGSTDAWSIDLDGNFSSSSILTTLDPVCLEKTAGDATLRFKIKQGGIKGMLVLVLYRTDAFEAGDCNPETCYAIEDSKWTQELHLNQWMQLTFPYDLSDWAVSDDCGDMPSVSVRPALYVLNHLSDDQGGMVTRTIISIDNFCLDGMLVDLDYLNNKQIFHLYPNPNTGQFTLNWQGAPWPDGRVEIAGPLGQTLRSFSVPEGAEQMEIQIADLPTGMYFVKVLSEGRVVKVMRVVKR
jgi:hypothetical protein